MSSIESSRVAHPHSIDIETFRDVPGCTGYRVSCLGRVQGRWQPHPRILLDSWHDLKPAVFAGYLRVALVYDDGFRRTRKVHRLVLEAFVGPRPVGFQARHLNGDRRDNRLENLAWGTALENARDRDRHGTTAVGEKSGVAKLTDRDAAAIRESLSAGASSVDLAREYGVHPATIRGIKYGQSYGSAGKITARPPGLRGEKAWNSKLTDDDVRAIRLRLSSGESQLAVAREFGVSGCVIWRIARGLSWAHVV